MCNVGGKKTSEKILLLKTKKSSFNPNQKKKRCKKFAHFYVIYKAGSG